MTLSTLAPSRVRIAGLPPSIKAALIRLRPTPVATVHQAVDDLPDLPVDPLANLGVESAWPSAAVSDQQSAGDALDASLGFAAHQHDGGDSFPPLELVELEVEEGSD